MTFLPGPTAMSQSPNWADERLGGVAATILKYVDDCPVRKESLETLLACQTIAAECGSIIRESEVLQILERLQPLMARLTATQSVEAKLIYDILLFDFYKWRSKPN